jgi:hypothetical protein
MLTRRWFGGLDMGGVIRVVQLSLLWLGILCGCNKEGLMVDVELVDEVV